MADSQRIGIYVSQALAGFSATGAIFADGQVTPLRVGLAAVAALASIAAMILAVRTAVDQARMEKKIQLLVENGSLPYTLEEDVNAQIDKVAVSLDLKPKALERFDGLNCYFFDRPPSDEVLVALRDKDLRTLFFAEKKRMEHLVGEWIRTGQPAEEVRDIAREVVFKAVGKATADDGDVIDPIRIRVFKGRDGSTDCEFSFPRSNRPTYHVAFNTDAWERKPFSIGVAMAQLFERVRREVMGIASPAAPPGVPVP